MIEGGGRKKTPPTKKSSLTVGTVLLIVSILTITYSIADKQVILYRKAGVTVPLRDNCKTWIKSVSEAYL